MIFSIHNCIVNPPSKADAKRFVWAPENFETPVRILEMAALNADKPLSEMKTLCRQSGCSKANHIL